MSIPKTRGLVITAGASPQVKFLKWNQIPLLFNSFPESTLKENCLNAIWHAASNYDPNTEIIKVNFYADAAGKIYMQHKIEPRRILIDAIATKAGLSRTEVKFIFSLYKKGTYTPEEASAVSGLSIKKILELTEYFNQENFYVD
jgi:hypothetical protein